MGVSTAVSTDVSVLEQIFAEESSSYDETIHIKCPNPGAHTHGICGFTRKQMRGVPEWLDATCEDCSKILKRIRDGEYFLCPGCLSRIV